MTTTEAPAAARFHYWVYFKSSSAAGHGEHTREVVLDHKVEYASDVDALREWCEKEVEATTVLIISWAPLLGGARPAAA